MNDFISSMESYEAAVESTLGLDFYVKDIKKKHKKMAKSPFLFLRATCWRWAESAGSLCPELLDGTIVPSIGDAHAGNFGLWRDAETRLVWGVNDYDEAAHLPYGLDLVRLCASILLADPGANASGAAASVLAGYRRGIDNPKPFVLERDDLWLRDAFASTPEDRETFWAELEKADAETPSKPIKAALAAALPDPVLDVSYSRRSAGAGSLGRARFVALGLYQGAPVAAEAKATMPCCWETGRIEGLAQALSHSRWRSADPHLRYGENYVTRRLAPNNRKIDMGETEGNLQTQLIEAMGFEIASIHTGIDAAQADIRHDLEKRPTSWLEEACARVARWTDEEFRAFSPPEN